MKKVISILLGCFLMATMVWAAGQQTEWPSRPITLLVPASPGGNSDAEGRAISESLTRILGRPVQVVNMSGGAGTLALNDLATSPADGYKVIYHQADTVISSLLKRLPGTWEDALDISAVNVAGGSNVVFVNSKSPYRTLGDLITAARANPGGISFGMETGGSVHMQILAIEKEAGVTFNKVDLGGAAPRIAALLGEQIDVISNGYGGGEQYVKSGDFRPLGLFATERNPYFPDIPTLIESGINIATESFAYFGFKKGTDPAIVQKFTIAVRQAAYEPRYTDTLGIYYFKADILTGQDAINYMRQVENFYSPYADILLSQQ